MIYLASPYSHSDPAVREARYAAACRAAAHLMLLGEVVYSPIAHSHPIEARMASAQNHQFWMSQCIPMVLLSSEVRVLRLDGWDTSEGIAKECRAAGRRGIPVTFMEPI